MLREQSIVYYPEDLALLGNVFDKVVASIPAVLRTPSNKTVIARSILVQAAAGECDPTKLEQAALMTVNGGPNSFQAPNRDRPDAVPSRRLQAGCIPLPQSARRMVATRRRLR